MAAGDAAAERAALADEVVLADELVEVARAHPGGERLPLGRWLEEGLGSGAGRAPGGGMPAMVARGRGRAPRQRRLRRAEPGDVDDDPQDEQDREQRAADDAMRRTSRAT